MWFIRIKRIFVDKVIHSYDSYDFEWKNIRIANRNKYNAIINHIMFWKSIFNNRYRDTKYSSHNKL